MQPLLTIALLILGAGILCARELPVANPAFESGGPGILQDRHSWVRLDLADSSPEQDVLTVSEGQGRDGGSGLMMEPSRTNARFGARSLAIPLQGARRLRVGAWVRVLADGDVQPQRGTPGVMLRVDFRDNRQQPTTANLPVVGLGGLVADRGSDLAQGNPVPAEWTHVTGVVDVPEGSTEANIHLIVWGMLGSPILWDDVTVETIEDAAGN